MKWKNSLVWIHNGSNAKVRLNDFHNQLQHEKFQYDSKTINQLRLAMRVKGSKDKDGASHGVVHSERIIAHKGIVEKKFLILEMA